ncbi:MAG: DUF1667 domain-containing protein [Candidatus Limivivens sp.]|nr:DUF1667 domain-containing protein [Candidatus Limivivens sp.]
MERELTCICCPLGCPLKVTLGETPTVSGNSCKRGADYGKKEVTDPRRIVTSSVRVTGGALPMVSVKTRSDIPKGKIFDCVLEIHQAVLEAPVHIGDVVIPDCAGTGVAVIATKNIETEGAVLPESRGEMP